MFHPSRDHHAKGLALFTVLLAALVIGYNAEVTAQPLDGLQTGGRTPKLREVAELPEDYVGREFTFTCRICTSGLWMKRNGMDFFLFLEDLEGSQLPAGGISPDSTVNLIRFVLPKEEGRKLIHQLSAARKYEVRIQFRVERERDIFGTGWRYLGKISSIELNPSTEQR